MASDENKTLFGGILTLLFIAFLVIGFIYLALTSNNSSDPATNPTVNDQPYTEPNFDNLENDGLINGQR